MCLEIVYFTIIKLVFVLKFFQIKIKIHDEHIVQYVKK